MTMTPSIRLIIAGSRTFEDFDLLRSKLDHFLGDKTDVEIVSGACRGADILGEVYARNRGFPIKPFPADWATGRGAGLKRNNDMACYATHCVCFWDGISKGTAHMIDIARAHGLVVRVVRFEAKKPEAKPQPKGILKTSVDPRTNQPTGI